MAADPLDQLRKLAALKEEGIVDEAEYNRLKQQLLSQAGSGNAAAEIESRTAQQPPAPPLGNPDASAPRVTETEVTEMHSTLVEYDEEFSSLQAQKLGRVDRVKKLQRRLRHLAWLAWARGKFENFALGAFGPTLIMIVAGIFIGVVMLDLISGIPGAMFIGALSGGVIAGLFAVHVFLIPSNSTIAFESTAKNTELIRLQTDLARDEPAFVDAGAKLNALRHQYDALLAEFKTARNHFLSVEWRSMRGKPFEVFLKDVFEYLGYDCRLTAKSGDQGVDLIAKKEGTKIAIQAKAYQNSVGNESVQQAVAGMRHYGCNQCAVITNSRFTPSAIELARTNNCKLIDETQIESLIVGEAGF
jgi:hypothetical protein